MIVLVDEERDVQNGAGRRFRPAPPVSNNIGGKEWDSKAIVRDRGADRERERDRRQLNSYEAGEQRRGHRERDVDAHSVSLSRNNSNYPPETSGRPNSSQSAGKHAGTSGDVSEFSFQLK